MARYIAFLRAINVGGRVVKMSELGSHFEALGFKKVETFIASGNVLFESPSKNIKGLEKKIEESLQKALGYEVATFIRSAEELMEIARHSPFSEMKEEDGLYIAFISQSPDEEAQKKLMSLKTKTDDFHVNKNEIYWHCRTRSSDSIFSGAVLEKLLRAKATLRNSTTIRKIVAKYNAS